MRGLYKTLSRLSDDDIILWALEKAWVKVDQQRETQDTKDLKTRLEKIHQKIRGYGEAYPLG